MTTVEKQLIRSAILRELARLGRSKYWLAQQVDMHPNVVNRALSTGYDMRVSTAERFLSALGLTVGNR